MAWVPARRVAYFEFIEAWREAGAYEGLEFRHVDAGGRP